MLKLCTWIRLKRCTCLWMCSDPDMFTVIFVLPSEHSPQPPYSKKLLVFSIMRSPPKKFTSIKVWNKKRGFAKPPNQQKLFSHILSYGTLPYVAHQMWTWGLEVVRPCRFSNIRKESWTLNCRPFVEKTHDVVFFSTVSVCNDFEGFKWFYINIYIYMYSWRDFWCHGWKTKIFCPSEKIKMKDGSKYQPCDVSYFSFGTVVNWRCAVVIQKLVILRFALVDMVWLERQPLLLLTIQKSQDQPPWMYEIPENGRIKYQPQLVLARFLPSTIFHGTQSTLTQLRGINNSSPCSSCLLI